MFESAAIYAKVGVQHYHMRIGFMKPTFIFTDVMFDDMSEVMDHYFGVIDSLFPDHLTEEEEDDAYDHFEEMVEYSEDAESDAYIAISEANLVVGVWDCHGCIPVGAN